MSQQLLEAVLEMACYSNLGFAVIPCPCQCGARRIDLYRVNTDGEPDMFAQVSGIDMVEALINARSAIHTLMADAKTRDDEVAELERLFNE